MEQNLTVVMDRIYDIASECKIEDAPTVIRRYAFGIDTAIAIEALSHLVVTEMARRKALQARLASIAVNGGRHGC